MRSEGRFDESRPCRRLLHWQGKAWLPLSDCSRLLERLPPVIGQ
ncbi:hypothetical protein [Pseudomonas sp. BN515]|nr:hypothetical protein [Pseudomonas sp. BN515]